MAKTKIKLTDMKCCKNHKIIFMASIGPQTLVLNIVILLIVQKYDIPE